MATREIIRLGNIPKSRFAGFDAPPLKEKMKVSDVDPGKGGRSRAAALFHLAARRRGKIGQKMVGMKKEERIGNIRAESGDKTGNIADLNRINVGRNEEGRGGQEVRSKTPPG